MFNSSYYRCLLVMPHRRRGHVRHSLAVVPTSDLPFVNKVSVRKNGVLSMLTANYTQVKKPKEKSPSEESKFRMRPLMDEIPTYKSYKVLRTDDVKTKILVNNKLTEKAKKVMVMTENVHKQRDGFNGYRAMRFINGNMYEGHFLKGRLDGHGKMTYARGNIYDGEWKKGKRHGFGVFKLKDGKIYEGEWVRDRQEGEVTVRFVSGDVLKCTCVDSKLEGHGTIAYANGDRFEGLFSNGRKNGGGVLTKSDGTRQIGIWKNGKYRPIEPVQSDFSVDTGDGDGAASEVSAIRQSLTGRGSAAGGAPIMSWAESVRSDLSPREKGEEKWAKQQAKARAD